MRQFRLFGIAHFASVMVCASCALFAQDAHAALPSFQVVPDMATLQTYDAATMALLQYIDLTGYSSASSLGAQRFVWHSTCPVASADGGMVIAPSDHPGSTAYGCLVSLAMSADPAYWGDKVDGTTLATSAWQSAFDNVLKLPVTCGVGTHLVGNVLIKRSDFSLSCAGSGAVIKFASGTTLGLSVAHYSDAAIGMAGTGCTGTSDFCPRIALSNFALDFSATLDDPTVKGIAISRSWDANVRSVTVIDPNVDQTNRYHVVFGDDVFTSSMTDLTATSVGARAAVLSTNNHIDTTISIERSTFVQFQAQYVSNLRFLNDTWQGVRNKIYHTGGPLFGVEVFNSDFEGHGCVLYSTVPDGMGNWAFVSNVYQAMRGNVFAPECGTNTWTGSSMPASGSHITDLAQALAPRPASVSQSGTTVTVKLDTTMTYYYDGILYFTYMAPLVGDYVNVSGSGAAPDGSWFKVTSRTVNTSTPKNEFTYEVTSSATGSYCSSMSCTVTPDNSYNGQRLSSLFGNSLVFDPLGKQVWLADGYNLVLGNQYCLSSLVAPNSHTLPAGATLANLACTDSAGRPVLGGSAGGGSGNRLIIDPTSGSVAVGPFTNSSGGMVSGAPTGGAQGTGSVNASSYWADGVPGIDGTLHLGTCTLVVNKGLIVSATMPCY